MTHGAVVAGGKIGVFLGAECALVWFLATRGDLGEASDWSDVFSIPSYSQDVGS